MLVENCEGLLKSCTLFWDLEEVHFFVKRVHYIIEPYKSSREFSIKLPPDALPVVLDKLPLPGYLLHTVFFCGYKSFRDFEFLKGLLKSMSIFENLARSSKIVYMRVPPAEPPVFNIQ